MFDLIRAAASRSGGQGELGARGGGDQSPASYFTAARGKNSPDFTNLGAPGVYLSGV